MLVAAPRQAKPPSRPRPFLKWAGGKGQLLDQLRPLMPGSFGRYFEPFLGGGAVYFALRPPTACLSDSNEELINTYRILRDRPADLLRALQPLRTDELTYYRWRDAEVSRLSDVKRAARLIYLNRTCYNGLYRVNKQGRFNVPYGRHRSPPRVKAAELRAASQALQRANLVCADYRQAVAQASAGDFIYLDPPYVPVSRYSDFKRYTQAFFSLEDHVALADAVRDLTRRGCLVMLSNSDCPQVRELYRGMRMTRVHARRRINKDGSKRSAISELVIRNY
jgi:DNA adenine methylase